MLSQSTAWRGTETRNCLFYGLQGRFYLCHDETPRSLVIFHCSEWHRPSFQVQHLDTQSSEIQLQWATVAVGL